MTQTEKEKIVTIFRKGIFASVAAIAILAFSIAVIGQAKARPMIIYGAAQAPTTLVKGSNLYCAGYIQSSAISEANTIIGANDEADRYNFKEHDILFINVGSNKGANIGDVFSVVRPKGAVESRWTDKSRIGFLVQEVGAVEVVNVQPEYSAVRVTFSCDAFYLGDLIQLSAKRTSPQAAQRPPLNLFATASGKASGRIILARDNVEMLAPEFIAYVDLGADNNVQTGDYLTIYRKLGKGNLMTYPAKESVRSRDDDYQSDTYSGGKFSNQAARKDGSKADGKTVTTSKAKQGRPALRKVVGEAVVLNVKEHTATIVITRTTGEVHTGDSVEIQ